MSSWSLRDHALLWHPFTQQKTAELPIAIKRGQGAYLYDEKENSYLDLISSWWVNLHGHANPYIAQQIYAQAQQLEHVIFAGFTHQPAVELCENLLPLLPASLKRFFFSDNGSTAVEVALKMAYQYWHNQGQSQRTLFLSIEGGYHGDTFGAMSVGNKSGFHEVYQNFLFATLNIPYPHTWQNDPDVQLKETHALAILDSYLTENSHKIAAIILEPLIQGASGMRICRPQFIETVVQRVRKKNILVIFDEIMTGFGRTGSCFALSQLNCSPDLLCLSKGITGGFLPLALTVSSEEIYQAFLHDEWQYALAHGHSYTANPLACAAAVASLELLLQPKTQQNIKNIMQTHQQGIDYLKEKCPQLLRPRICGTISAFDLPELPQLSLLKQEFLAAGLLLRPLKNTVYLLPPYVITPDELFNAYKIIAKVLQKIFIKNISW